MNYSKLLKGFTKEFGQFSQYKKLGQPMKVFAIVGMLPFLIAAFVCIGLMYVYMFLYNGMASSVEYLESWLKEFKKDVSNGIAEAVVYLVALPFIYGFRCLLSLFAFSYYILWFEIMCVSYIASLAGIRWQPFIANATFDEDQVVVASTKKKTSKVIISIIFVLFCFIVAFKFIVLIITTSVSPADFSSIQAYYEIIDFILRLSSFASFLEYVYYAFTILAVAIGFRHIVVKADDPRATFVPEKEEPKVKRDAEDQFPEI